MRVPVLACAVFLASFAWAAPKAGGGARPRSPETAQSLVVEALRRAQADLARDACLIGAEISLGCSYTAGVGVGLERKDAVYYFDSFSFWFKSPQRQWYQRVSRCDAAGEQGLDQPNCLAPLGTWSSEDKKPGPYTPPGKCLDELGFDSDKAGAAAIAKGLTTDGRCFMSLYLRVMDSPAKRHKRLKGKTVWIAADDDDSKNLRRCLAFDAADGKPLFDGSCDGLTW